MRDRLGQVQELLVGLQWGLKEWQDGGQKLEKVMASALP